MFLISSALLEGHVTLASFPSTQSVTASTVIRRGKPQSMVCSPMKVPGEILVIKLWQAYQTWTHMNPFPNLLQSLLWTWIQVGQLTGSTESTINNYKSIWRQFVCLEIAGRPRLQASHVKFAVEERLQTVRKDMRSLRSQPSPKFKRSVASAFLLLHFNWLNSSLPLSCKQVHHIIRPVHRSIPTHPHPCKFRALGGSPCLRRQSRHMPFHLWARTRSWLAQPRATAAAQSEVMLSKLQKSNDWWARRN